MSEEEAYKIFSEMTPDVLDYVFCLAKAYTEKDKEIERLNKQIEEYQKALDETTSEKIDLQSIIEEVREAIRILETNYDIVDYQAQKLYQILDKENI